LKCESLALAKYIDKSPKIFFIYGEEIVLQNHARDSINKFFYEKGFTEKKIIVKKDFPNIQKILVENAGGSLFGTKIIIEIIHEGGKIPNDLLSIFSLRESDNYVILIRSAIKKISNNSSWVKQVDKSALIIECKKLKSFEEKIWLKNNLEFISEKQVKQYVQRISELFPGNLVAQQNEINLLRLMYEEKNEISTGLIYDGGEFSPYELEDKIIELNTSGALRILKSIHKNDDHYAQLLVWVIGKVINTSVAALQSSNIQSGLESAGIWSSKIPSYMSFIKKNSLRQIIPLQKKIYELDLASKGLAGLTKEQFWQELDNVVVKLTA
tara:strand:+ start:4621 stop:5598 length:978 start_codon:yes stop_codon:yes gene_type:complete